MNIIEQNFLDAQNILEQFIKDDKNFAAIKEAGKIMISSLKKGSKIISCGNGGSMADAMHFAEELTGRFKENRQPLSALAIADPTHITCVANDFGFNQIFSRYIDAIGKKGDVLLAISTSGDSENVINAIKTAKVKNMSVVGLTGKNGGIMQDICDVEIRAPYSKYSDRAQEIHIKVIHTLIDFIESNLK